MIEAKRYIHSDSLYLEDPNEEKTKRMCSMCRQVKDETEFYYREKQHTYNTYCRNCERAYNTQYMRSYREMHPEYVERNRLRMRKKCQKRKMEEENYNHIPRLD